MTTQQKMTEAEQALQEWGVDYTKQDDGTIVVEGDIDIRSKGLTKLPDLSKVIVKGNFFCHNNQLTSLTGAPASIGGSFLCNDNQLTSLAGAPASVGESFWCNDNQLTSLTGAPASVGENFWCEGNQLTSLVGSPASIAGDFLCHNNQLTSLAGAPASIGNHFYCFSNQLTSLEGSPQKFEALRSDFGDFTSWDEVPEHLRISPETKEKEKQARLETLNRIGAASTQRQAFKPMPSIRFKAGPK